MGTLWYCFWNAFQKWVYVYIYGFCKCQWLFNTTRHIINVSNMQAGHFIALCHVSVGQNNRVIKSLSRPI